MVGDTHTTRRGTGLLPFDTSTMPLSYILPTYPLPPRLPLSLEGVRPGLPDVERVPVARMDTGSAVVDAAPHVVVARVCDLPVC